MLLGTTLESAADVQLYRFRKNQNHVPGVITTGLWQYSRHPNYLGEVLFWFREMSLQKKRGYIAD